MRTRSRWTTVLIMLALGAIVLSACGAQPSPAAQTAAERTAAAKRGTIRASVSASGKIDPAGKVNLNFGVPGTVQDVLVSEGQTVQQGDVLAKLDTDNLELAVKQAEQALATQKSGLHAGDITHDQRCGRRRSGYCQCVVELEAARHTR